MTIAAAKALGPMRAPALQNSPTYHYWRCLAPVEVEPRCRRASSWWLYSGLVVLERSLRLRLSYIGTAVRVLEISCSAFVKTLVFGLAIQPSPGINFWRFSGSDRTSLPPRLGVVGSLVHWAYGPAVFITASHCLFFLDLFLTGLILKILSDHDDATNETEKHLRGLYS